jgi:hypothetical protein
MGIGLMGRIVTDSGMLGMVELVLGVGHGHLVAARFNI